MKARLNSRGVGSSTQRIGDLRFTIRQTEHAGVLVILQRNVRDVTVHETIQDIPTALVSLVRHHLNDRCVKRRFGFLAEVIQKTLVGIPVGDFIGANEVILAVNGCLDVVAAVETVF